MAARIGEGRTGGASARELGIQLDHVADVDDDEEGRPALGGGQRPGVALGLRAGAHQGVEEALRRCGGVDLLRLEHEGAPLAAVDVAGARAAVAMREGGAALEDVGVVACVVERRVGRRQLQQPAQAVQEQLVVVALRARRLGPAADEVVDRWRSGMGSAESSHTTRGSWPRASDSGRRRVPSAWAARRVERGDPGRQLLFDDAPHHLVVDTGIRMHEHIARADDAAQILDRLRRWRGAGALQPAECFAADAELPLDGRAQELVGQVAVERVAVGEPLHAQRCMARVPEQLACVSVHGRIGVRRSPGCALALPSPATCACPSSASRARWSRVPARRQACVRRC